MGAWSFAFCPFERWGERTRRQHWGGGGVDVSTCHPIPGILCETISMLAFIDTPAEKKNIQILWDIYSKGLPFFSKVFFSNGIC